MLNLHGKYLFDCVTDVSPFSCSVDERLKWKDSFEKLLSSQSKGSSTFTGHIKNLINTTEMN